MSRQTVNRYKIRFATFQRLRTDLAINFLEANMADRFYVPGPWAELVEITGQEAQHLSRVLRAEPGDEIEIFDGQGHSSTAIVESVRKQAVLARRNAPANLSVAPRQQVILAVAVPKGDRFSWLIEKLTESGVDRLIPLTTARSVVKPSDQKLLKGEQTVIAACKQSRRDQLMKIDDLCPLGELPQRLPAGSRMFVGDPQGEGGESPFEKNDDEITALVGVIGPEGGFTPAELELLKGWGAFSISLSPHVLRVETAAIACGVWFVAWRMRCPKADF